MTQIKNALQAAGDRALGLFHQSSILMQWMSSGTDMSNFRTWLLPVLTSTDFGCPLLPQDWTSFAKRPFSWPQGPLCTRFPTCAPTVTDGRKGPQGNLRTRRKRTDVPATTAYPVALRGALKFGLSKTATERSQESLDERAAKDPASPMAIPAM